MATMSAEPRESQKRPGTSYAKLFQKLVYATELILIPWILLWVTIRIYACFTFGICSGLFESRKSAVENINRKNSS